MIRKWGWLSLLLLALGVVAGAIWVASFRLQVIYQRRLDFNVPGPDFQAGLTPGIFYLTYHPTQHFGLDQHWSIYRYQGDAPSPRWWFKLWQKARFTAHRATVIPLWAPTLILLVPGIALGIRRTIKFSAPSPCPNCGYSMLGLATGTPCPECGRKPKDASD